jgi:Protein of unknown function (DUF2844)
MVNVLKRVLGASRRNHSFGAAIVMVVYSLTANATLEGDVSSVFEDRDKLLARLDIKPGKNYSDYELRLPDGIVIHEFLNSAGRVFEVTWSGKGHRPNMEQLLGEHVRHYGHSNQSGRAMNRRFEHSGSNLIIRSRLHNRYFSGYAIIPQLAPDDFPVEQNNSEINRP